MAPHILYLHGFASSPGSKKASIFRDMLAGRGIALHVPDLNAPSFERLTLTGMLARVAETIRALPEGEVCLIGSSLGGLTALHFADRYRSAEARRVTRLLLLAPALDFMANRDRQFGAEGMAQWRETGWREFYNFAAGGVKPVHYGLVEDVLGYDSYAVQSDLPMLIIHGQHDASVPVEQSVRFAEGRPNVELRVVNSDHELLDQTEVIYQAMVTFFGL